MMATLLKELKEGESAILKGFNDLFIEEKLIEMGCLPGDKITLLQKAPLGDPYFVQIGESQLGLRLSEAATIIIEEVA